MKKRGFTLIEVLITLAIIGVIAALTLPNFISSYQDRVYITSLQRTYNQLTNSMVRYLYDNAVEKVSQTPLTGYSGITEYMQKYLRSRMTCPFGIGNCLAETYRSLNNSSGSMSKSDMMSNEQLGSSGYCYILESGAVVCMSHYGKNGYQGSKVVIDVNGKKDPNTNGRDLFFIDLLENGNFGYIGSESTDCSGWSSFCLNKVLSDGWQVNY